jgi:hypothetical protein
MNKIISYIVTLLCCILYISCGSDESSETTTNYVDVQYLSTLYGKTYEQLKSSKIGVIKEESEVYSDIDNPIKGTAIISELVIEGYNMTAHYYIFENKVIEIGIQKTFLKDADGVECYKKLIKIAYDYWGNPSINYLIKGEVLPQESKKQLEVFWNSQFEIETFQSVSMSFKENPLICYAYNASVRDILSSVDITIGGFE